MLHDYNQRFYSKLFERTKQMAEDDFSKIKRIASWKKRLKRAWKNINVIECSVFENAGDMFEMDHVYTGHVVLDLNEISAADIGVELVITENGERLVSKHEFKLDNSTSDKATYSVEVSIKQAGTFSYGIRIFPKNENLPHRQDINLIRWI
jgi:hypothetical protein